MVRPHRMRFWPLFGRVLRLGTPKRRLQRPAATPESAKIERFGRNLPRRGTEQSALGGYCARAYRVCGPDGSATSGIWSFGRVATASRSSSKRSAYVSSVIAANACPSMRCTAFTLAQDLSASNAPD